MEHNGALSPLLPETGLGRSFQGNTKQGGVRKGGIRSVRLDLSANT